VFSEILEKTVYHFLSGGIVMPALLITSVYMWLLIFMKMFQFVRIRNSEESFDKCLKAFSENSEYVGSDWQRELMKFSSEISFITGKKRKRMLESFVGSLSEGISRHVLTVMVLASAAPLFGLFGTVSGMIDTFDVISFHGTGNPKAMASGISVALVTTQAGLVVAVPGLVMGNFLSRRAGRIQDRIQLFAHMLVKELDK